MIENGEFIPKWKHEYNMENRKRYYEDKAKELKLKTSDAVLQEYLDSADKVRELQEENRELRKKYEETAMELSDAKLDVPEVKVIINGIRYNIT